MRTLDLEESERRLLLRLTNEEWNRLNAIRESRYIDPDPVLAQQVEVENLAAKLR